MSSNQDSLALALGQIERYISESAAFGSDLSRDLSSYRSGMQFALFTIVSALKLTPNFNATLLQEFAKTALDNPPPGFENDKLFQEPLALLMNLTDESSH